MQLLQDGRNLPGVDMTKNRELVFRTTIDDESRVNGRWQVEVA